MGILSRRKIDRHPDCTPELENKLIKEAEDSIKTAAYEMRTSNETVSRPTFNSARDNALRALNKLRESCGGIAIRGKSFGNSESAYNELYDYYKSRFDREIEDEKDEY